MSNTDIAARVAAANAAQKTKAHPNKGLTTPHPVSGKRRKRS